MGNINSLYIQICIELDNLKPLYKNLMNKKEKTPEERITQLDTIWIIQQLENFIKILDNSNNFKDLYNNYRKISLKFYHLFN